MVNLTPIIDPLVKDLIDERNILKDLVKGFGSPLNIVFPQKMADNIQSFKQVLAAHHINGKLYYAHKANKSKALVKQTLSEGICIDVASEKELVDALKSGFQGSLIEATGPKNEEFLLLSILQDCLIQADSFFELEEIVRFHKKLRLKSPVRILIRFSGFKATDTKIAPKDSRFGIPISQSEQVKELLLRSKNASSLSNKEYLNFQGFAFHLDANTTKEKSVAVENLIQLQESFQNVGLEPQIFNLGGGFKINYLENEKDWTFFLGALQQATLGEIPSITWNNSNYGLRTEGKAVRGSVNFYNYFNKIAGASYLDEILSTKLTTSDNLTIGQFLSETMKDLIIEPGRSLLDQVGITVAKVNFVKESPGGETLVGLDMNRSNLASTDQEMMLDPIIIFSSEKQLKEKIGVYFVGNLCLESDFIYKHKTFISQLPEPGDLVVFVNTAAYNMDFTESSTIQQSLAKKIAVIKQNDQFIWFEDEKYNPFLLEKQS